MQTLSPLTRTERIIIVSRIVLATFSLLAIWLDPIEPAATASLTFRILQVYFFYAVCLLPILLWFPLQIKRIGLCSHIIDVCLYSLLVTITQGSASPFFSYFIFALFAAALRWQKSGILWSALAFLCLLVGSGIFLELETRLDDSGLELNRFIIRNVHLTVVALLLIYLTTYEKKLRQELNKLGEWPLHMPSSSDPHAFIRETLAYASNLLETPRIMMLWEESEEPLTNLALLDSDHLFWQILPPSSYESAISSSFTDCHFLSSDIEQPANKILCATQSGLEYRRGPPLDPLLIQKHHLTAVIGLSLSGQTFQGHLLILDKPAINLDDLSLGILVSQQVATRMDQFFLRARQQETTAIEERIKMARNLHDGVLQTLTGIALHVKNIGRIIQSDAITARQELESLQTLIQAEQRNLRQFIQQLKPNTKVYSNTLSDLEQRLQELADIIEQQWGLQIQIAIKPITLPVSLAYTEDIYHLIREALINCARHAQATLAQVGLDISDGSLNIHVMDDGKGFPFQGCYDLPKLTVMSLGPKTIMERTRALDGTLIIQSQKGNTLLEIKLPLMANTNAKLAREHV